MRKAKGPRLTLSVNASIPRQRDVRPEPGAPEPAGEALDDVPDWLSASVQRAPMFADGLKDGVYAAETLLAGRPVYFLVYAGKLIEWRRQDDDTTEKEMASYLWQTLDALRAPFRRPALTVVAGGLAS